MVKETDITASLAAMAETGQDGRHVELCAGPALPHDEAPAGEEAPIDKSEVVLEASASSRDADLKTKSAEDVARESVSDKIEIAAPVEPIPKLVPSILYCVPACLLDITSGAALSQRTLMIALAQRGFRTVALQATIFDSPKGGEHVIKAGEAHKDKPILRANTHGVAHIILRTKATVRREMTCAEQELYLQLFRQEIRQRPPDMIFIWGGMLLEMTMMREARDAGIPVIFYLVNGSYKNKETFRYVSTVVTDTRATAELYRDRLGLECKVVGKFIDPGLVKPKVPRRPDFLTFINPSFEKGVSVFMPLAKLAAEEAPEIRFLVVQARGRWGNALRVLKYRPEDFPNVKVIDHRLDMRPVYASTRALLLPSLWHESGARVIAEAQINGIPVLASKTGGSAEMIGTGGVLFEVPEVFREKKTVPVPEEVVRSWLAEIKRVWHDAAYYENLCRKAENEAGKHDIAKSTDRFLRAVSPAVLASKGINPAVTSGMGARIGSTTPKKASKRSAKGRRQTKRSKS